MSYLARGQDEFQSRNPTDRFTHRRGRTCLHCDELFIRKGWEGNSLKPSRISRLNLFRALRSDNRTIKCYLHDVASNISFRLSICAVDVRCAYEYEKCDINCNC